MTFRRMLALSLMLLCACGGEKDPTKPGGGDDSCPALTNAQTVRDVVLPGDRYEYELIAAGTDPRAHPAFAAIWDVLKVQNNLECWQAQGGTNNLQFFENPAFGPGPRYRFVGSLDTEAGPLVVYSVGCYIDPQGRSYRAAVITTWTGDLEVLGLTGPTTIDHFIGYQGNVPLITRYVATAANCL